MRRSKTQELTITGLLTALALIIPLVFTGLRIVIPPAFTATLLSHVPSMIAMFISPFAAVGVGLASALGFTIFVSPLIGARALAHAAFALVGYYLYRRGMPMWLVLLVVMPIHAAGEFLAVVAFGLPASVAGFTAFGTAIHHLMDSAATLVIIMALSKAGLSKWFARPDASAQRKAA